MDFSADLKNQGMSSHNFCHIPTQSLQKTKHAPGSKQLTPLWWYGRSLTGPPAISEPADTVFLPVLQEQ